MTLPSTPPISLLQVYAEFGAPAGTPLSQFFSGGPWVPAANTNVPNKPPISLLNLLGASVAAGGSTGLAATISPASIYTPTAQKTVTSGPVIVSLTGATGTVSAAWSLVSGDASISISSTAGLTVTFRAVFPEGGDTKTATWRCVLTDSGTGKTGSVSIVVTFESI